jgi:hypothetical protein
MAERRRNARLACAVAFTLLGAALVAPAACAADVLDVEASISTFDHAPPFPVAGGVGGAARRALLQHRGQAAPWRPPAPRPAPRVAAAAAGAGMGAAAAPLPTVPRSPAPAGKVLVELFVMSLCPDAAYCIRTLAPLLAQLSPIVHVQTQ